MIELVFEALAAGLSIWANKEKTKYVDQLMELKTQYYEESNKPIADRSDATIDNLEFKLRLLVSGFSSAALQSNPAPES